MPELAAFQREFAAALMSDVQRSPAFAVYRNTAARGAVEALRATYSTVNELLGEDGFTEVALEYRREVQPAGPVLSDYGADFSEFLARQPWTSELPYLADVARLDWLWLESFLAADDGALPGQIGAAPRIMLHPAARFAWLATPALTIWQAHRDPQGFDELEPEWREEGALFTRPGLCVGAVAIDAACHRLLLGCSTPARVDELVTGVAAEFPAADIPALLQQCVANGALIIR
jgi:hypothetical protein